MNKIIKQALAGVAALGIAASGLALGAASAYADDPTTGNITITGAKTDHTFSGWHLASLKSITYKTDKSIDGFLVDTDNAHVSDIEDAMKEVKAGADGNVSETGTSLYDTYKADKNYFLGDSNVDNNPMGWFTATYKGTEVTSPWGGGGKTGAQSVLRAFAQALSKQVAKDDASTPDKTDFKANAAGEANENVTQGLWFLKDTTATSDETAKEETNSIPIITPTTFEGADGWGTIAIKNTTPTIDKKLVDPNANGGYDANTQPDYAVGNTVTYELTSTIPTYTGYDIDPTMQDEAKTRVFQIVDTADKALTVDQATVVKSVKVGDTELTNGKDYDVTVANYSGTEEAYKNGHVTTIDLKRYVNKSNNNTPDNTSDDSVSATAGIDEGATVTVIVQATLNDQAQITTPGDTPKKNLNKVDLKYSNKPEEVKDAHKVPGPEVPVYSYLFNIHKTNKAGNENLQGAVFTLKTVTATSKVEKDHYLGYENGAWKDLGTTEPAKTATTTAAGAFTTGTDGKIAFEGLDAGTYEVHEIVAPKDYTSVGLPTFTFELKPTVGSEKNGHKTITSASLEYTANSSPYVSKDGATLNVWNAKNITELPKTGGAGLALIVVVGGLFIAAAGIFGLRARRS
ncbi:isopeptide-forming domain-containing fimbrial protein [Bifidobacterium simiiventris]|uniref:isopeptide-forming domain-containing fimbrial protein n=1 Tax=Bifidobacterium simiiventris TaxID=2834434 RepID=UPI001C572C09|nr:isopeptide-forming domain-containing fimbrial protein [Bifidobacterium simiiventris]MBW3078582.1 isopeptide-forming domain-containing fimbrial protein [Bifidobacterium simiiventris]